MKKKGEWLSGGGHPDLRLATQKNLLAFSAGVDSSALFFLLIEHNIPFDIALVNYGTREQSDDEERYARKLADRYGLECYVTHAPQFESHFECRARKFRYEFFDSLIAEHGYDNLLTAHQLNDRLEWMLMRLSKGAGIGEMLGMESVEQREGYTIVRPLLGYTKGQLLEYLHEHGHKYFVDESNADERYERNYFRKHFADPLIEEFGDGIARSMEYLSKDREILDSGFEEIFTQKELRILRLTNPALKVRAADKALKKLGYLLSSAQRQEIEENESVVIGGKWTVEISGDLLYIAPYIKVPIPKEFKEKCRRDRIPAKARGYIWSEEIKVLDVP